MIISRTATMRCAVEEHVLGAAEADALGAEAPRRARRPAACRHWRARPWCAPRRPIPSASRNRRESSGWTVGTSPSMTSPVEPLMVMMLAGLHDLARAPAMVPRARSRRGDRRRRRRRRRPMPRATTAAWLVMPPRVVRMPRAACMPWMSSGLVSMRTRITSSPLAARLSASSAENTTRARGGAGRGRQAARQDLVFGALGSSVGWRSWSSDCGSMRRIASSLPMSAALRHVDRDLERRRRGALAGAGLQHEELALLHRELDVLHVAVVLLERLRAPRSSSAKTCGITSSIAGSDELVGRLAGERQMLRRADAGDHVLALRVDEILAVELVGAGRGIAGEGDAGGAVVAHVAEDHRLDVDRGAPIGRDVVQAAIGDGALVHPRAEDGADRAPELLLRVLREGLAELALDDCPCSRRRRPSNPRP